MQRFSVSHLSNPELTRGLLNRITRDRVHTAELLAYLAEFDARKLYRPAGYPSIHAYCLGELRLSEDAADKRITVARLAVRYPVILELAADGRLHLSGAVLLAPHLRDETVDDLLAAATHRSKAEIERVIAERFPRNQDGAISLELTEQSQALTDVESAPGRIGDRIPPAPGRVGSDSDHDSGRAGTTGPDAHAATSKPHHRARITPIGPGLFELRTTLDKEDLDQLRQAQDLLSHCVWREDVTEVLRRALQALVIQLEKRKFGAASKPRAVRSGTRAPRTIPAHVRRAVWERDGGRCTFVSETGHRCEARDRLEFDHIREVARGGVATVGNVRLLCRAHNQHEAERSFGAEFMRGKRFEASRARRAAPPRSEAGERHGTADSGTCARKQASEIVPWLRSLGLRSAEAQRAAESIRLEPEAALEDRVRAALAFHGATRRSRKGLPAGEVPGTASHIASNPEIPRVQCP